MKWGISPSTVYEALIILCLFFIILKNQGYHIPRCVCWLCFRTTEGVLAWFSSIWGWYCLVRNGYPIAASSVTHATASKGGVISGAWSMNLAALDNYEFSFKGFYTVHDLEYPAHIIRLRLAHARCIISDTSPTNNAALLPTLTNLLWFPDTLPAALQSLNWRRGSKALIEASPAPRTRQRNISTSWTQNHAETLVVLSTLQEHPDPVCGEIWTVASRSPHPVEGLSTLREGPWLTN